MRAAICASLMFCLTPMAAQAEGELHIVSQRPGDPEAAPYADFTRRTGIRIVFVPNERGAAIEALKASPRGPGDVFMGTDAAGLYPVEQADVLEPFSSEAVRATVPTHLRHPKDLWFGVSSRARVVIAGADLADPPKTFADLADPRFKAKVCVGSGGSPYNLSLIGRMAVHLGEAKARDWARGVVANLAPNVPVAGDGAQILAVADGRCGVTVSNHYYFLRMAGPEASEAEQAAVKSVRLVWPDQGEGQSGAMANVTAVGLLRDADEPEAARKFLDYLATAEAQTAIAGKTFWPAAATAQPSQELRALGSPRWDMVNVAELGAARPIAERIVKDTGWPTPRR